MTDLVGEAFVRITADTTAMRQAIRRAGAEDGKAYGTAFNKEVDEASDNIYRKTRKRLAEGLADPKVFDRWAKEFDSVEDAAQKFRGALDDVSKSSKFGAARQGQYTKALNDWEQSAIDARKAAFNLAEANEAEAKAKTYQTKSLRNFFVLQNEGYKRLVVHQRQQEKITARLARVTQVAGVEIERHGSRVVNMARTTRQGLDRVTTHTDRFGIVMGRVFGKGSRNNFLNWVGSMVGGLTRLSIGVFTFPLRALSHIADTFGTTFSASRAAGIGKVASAGKALLSVFGGKGGLAGAIGGVVAGGFLLGEVLPGVISLMSMLGGVVSALAGSISIGLTGAFLAAIPAISGAVAGLGGLASVFIGFFRNEDNKKFIENFFKPFKDMNKLYEPQVKKFLTNVRSGFDDLIKDIRPSIDTFFSSFQKKMNDSSTKKALSAWSDSIGKIANSFSRAGTSFLSGLTGFFVPVLPYAERLARWVEKIAADFDKWVAKGENQNKIAAFMDKAWIAADKVFRIIGNIGGIIGDVFMGGEQTGTTLLDRMLQKLQEINTFLDTPEGKAKMEEWFGDVKQIGTDLGKLATSVGTIIKNLNSPEGRANAIAIMDAIVTMGNAAVKVTQLADQIGRIAGYLNPIKTIFGLLFPDKSTAPAAATQSVPKTPSVAQLTKSGSSDALNEYKIKLKPDVKEFKLQLAAIEAYQSTGVQIPIKGNEALWEATKHSIANVIFKPKQVPIEADPTEWDRTKGTVQAFVFDQKTVAITANAKPAIAAIDRVKEWLSTLPSSKTIRIAGVNSVGGITMARGGILTSPTWTHPNVLAGEAGREAYVPLDRPLDQIDPAVRALAAIAQGKTSMAGGGVIGATRSISIAPGAIIVQSPHSNPALVAEAVLDRLVSFA